MDGRNGRNKRIADRVWMLIRLHNMCIFVQYHAKTGCVRIGLASKELYNCNWNIQRPQNQPVLLVRALLLI